MKKRTNINTFPLVRSVAFHCTLSGDNDLTLWFRCPIQEMHQKKHMFVILFLWSEDVKISEIHGTEIQHEAEASYE
jgi:hypothetical protein